MNPVMMPSQAADDVRGVPGRKIATMSTEHVLMQPLIEGGIIQHDAMETSVLNYIELARRYIGNFQATQHGLVYCCAWLAVEQYVPSYAGTYLHL